MPTILILIASLLFAVPAVAGETVKSPNVEKGLLELEQKGTYKIDQAAALDDKKELEFNAGYGVTENWKTKGEFTFDEDKAGALVYRRFKFENVYQLLKAKDGYLADVALYNDVSFSDRSDSSHDMTFGLLARKDVGNTTNIGNVYIKRDFGDTAARGVNFIYRWQTRYNLSKVFQPGFELLGDTKKRDNFDNQTLGIGPAVFGSFAIDDKRKIGYELMYTIGVTPVTPDGTLKWKLKYGFQF
jgi:hypothetical protein